jgi:putative tricarboxylic transport membrane protein
MPVVVYAIVALILLFPLVRRLLPKKAAPAVLTGAVHDIEEAHHQHGTTDAVSVEARKKTSSGGADSL